MTGLLRILLLWVLAVAVPAQGWAATALLSCGAGHARMVQSMEKPPRGGSAAGQHAGERHGHATPWRQPLSASAPQTVAGAVAVPSAEPPSSAHGDPLHAGAGNGSAPLDLSSCSACAACCPALALPGGLVLPAPPEALGVAGLPPELRLASHLPDGLERPPRHPGV